MTQQGRLGFRQLFKATVKDLRQNTQIFILMALLWAVLSTILSAPLLEDFVILQKAIRNDPDSLAGILVQNGPKLLTYSIINMLVLMALPTLWSRLLLRGRGGVFGPDLISCYGLVLFRAISLVGYQILALIFVFIFSIMLISIGNLAGLGEPILLIVPPILSLVALVPLYLAFTLSVAGTSIGHKNFGILPALKEFQRYLGPWLSLAALTVLTCSIISSLMISPFLGEDNSPTRVSTIISGLANGVMLLLIFTIAIAHYRHYLMPQEQEDVLDS